MFTTDVRLPDGVPGNAHRSLFPKERSRPGAPVHNNEAWEGSAPRPDAGAVDEEVAWHLRRVCHYGEESVSGSYGAPRAEVREEAPGTQLTAVQAFPPVQWTESVTRPQVLSSAQDELLVFKHEGYRVHNAGLAAALVPEPGAPVSVCEPRRSASTRYLTATDGDHPLYSSTPEGPHLDCLEVEVRWGGVINDEQRTEPLSVYAMFIDASGLVLGRVSESTRWFLTQTRYTAGLHCLYKHNDHGGYTTVFLHLSEMPIEVASIYICARCDKLKTVSSLHTTVSSRETLYAAGLEAEFVLDNTQRRDIEGDANIDGPCTVAVARLKRYGRRWGVGALNNVTPSERLGTDAMLTWVYMDRRRERDRQREYTEKMKTGVTGGQLKTALLRLPPNPKLTFEQMAALFNAHDKTLSGSLSLTEYVGMLEDVYWAIGENPPPCEVLHHLAEKELKAMDRNQNGKLSLDEFIALFHTSELHNILLRAAARTGFDTEAYIRSFTGIKAEKKGSLSAD